MYHKNDELHLVSTASPVFAPVLVDEALPISMVPVGGFDVQTARDQARREAFHDASEAAVFAR